MASFYQFTDVTPNTDPHSRILVLQNAALPAAERLNTWYQIALLAVGSCALLYGTIATAWRFLPARRRGLTSARHLLWTLTLPLRKLGKLVKGSRDINGVHIPATRRSDDASLQSVTDTSITARDCQGKGFCITGSGEPVLCTSASCALHIITVSEHLVLNDISEESILGDKSSRRATTSLINSLASERWSTAQKARVLVLARVELSILDPVNATKSAVDLKASTLNDYRLRKGLDGLLICHEGPVHSPVNNVLQELRHAGVPVILQTQADSVILDTLDYRLIDGVVLENACILPDGDRRDFYRAKRVRDCAARCKRERESRPGYFLGFLETWNVQPSSAVLRRAYKLADFFGASVSTRGIGATGTDAKIGDMPMSGFEWLKKSDVAWLQKAWSTHKRFSLQATADDRALDLDLSILPDAIPGAQHLLLSHPVRSELLPADWNADSEIPALDYVSEAPLRANIWDYASCGTPLCLFGCYSIRDEITQDQYAAILGIQRSLKQRKLLLIFSDAELMRVAQSLKTIIAKSAYSKLLTIFLESLASGNVRIFEGLDSGFTLPDNGGHLWALADESSDEGTAHLDLHISQKSYNDVATIWHIFLAHHHVPRVQRYEEELLLSSAQGDPEGNDDAQLPVSLARDLEESTEAELLYLMEQITVSEQQDRLTTAIVRVCESLLIDDTTRRAWIALHSRSCLDPDFSIQFVLQQRLAHFSSSGADRLPDLTNLMTFYKRLAYSVESALLHNDKGMLKKLTAPVLEAYGHAGTLRPVTPTVDLYGLLFFCALRRLAFESIYLEATDRCPLFLAQPDQASVFAELWSLGSQCELYFGLLPRDLGDIIYNKYRQYLVRKPPPVGAWDGKDVFSAFSMPEPPVSAIEGTVVPGSGSGVVPSGRNEKKNAGRTPSPPRIQRAAREMGALSIFCVPAIIDVILLATLGRGLFLTAFMVRSTI